MRWIERQLLVHRQLPIMAALGVSTLLPRDLQITHLEISPGNLRQVNVILEPGVPVVDAKVDFEKETVRFSSRDRSRWYACVCTWAAWVACWEGSKPFTDRRMVGPGHVAMVRR